MMLQNFYYDQYENLVKLVAKNLSHPHKLPYSISRKNKEIFNTVM